MRRTEVLQERRMIKFEALYSRRQGFAPSLDDSATDGLSSDRRMAGRPRRSFCFDEESPGSTETRCQVTPGEGNLRESATEIKPPLDLRVLR